MNGSIFILPKVAITVQTNRMEETASWLANEGRRVRERWMTEQKSENLNTEWKKERKKKSEGKKHSVGRAMKELNNKAQKRKL